MARDFDKEIGDLEADLVAKRAQLEELRVRFIDAAGEFLAEWYWSETERNVRSDPETTTKLGLPGLSQLKAQVADLQTDAPHAITTAFENPRLWWHLEPADQMYTWYGNRAPDVLDTALRRAANGLAAPLLEYGYLANRSANRPFYAHNLDWSSKMRSIVSTYDEIHGRAVGQFARLLQLKRAKAEHDATDLWNKA